MTEGAARSSLIQRKCGYFLNSTMLLLVLATLLIIANYGNAADNLSGRTGDGRDGNTLRSSEDEDVEKKIFSKKPRMNSNDDADLMLTEEDVDKFDDYFVDDDDDEGFDEGVEVEDDVLDRNDDESSEEVLDEDDLWLFQYDPVEVGHVQDIEVEDGAVLKMKTLAVNPPIFEIKNFLSSEECEHVKALAVKKGLQTSLTVPEKPTLTEAEQEEAREYFGELDQDEDGFMNGTELYEAVKLFPSAQKFNLTTEHVEELIKVKLDKDGDGLLDVDEFLEADTPAMEEEIDKWFVVIGNLGENEIKRSQPRVSEQAWLDQWTTEDEVLLRLQDRVIGLTLLPSSIIQTSEHLQVVRYQPGGHYHAHYDSDELDDDLECSHTFGIEDSDEERRYRNRDDFTQKRLCRLATVLYYLNDVEEGGGTAFPVADNETFTEESLDEMPYDIYDLSSHCLKSNVVVPPEKGKAILWYNHYLDETRGWIGENRNHSLHGGCDVIKGTKWIANNWITVDNHVERQIMFHDKYYSLLDQQSGEARYTFTPPTEAGELAEGDGGATDDEAEIDEPLRYGDGDDFAKDGGYGSETEITRRATEQISSDIDEKFVKRQSHVDSEDELHSYDQEKEKEGKVQNVSHRKAREKLDDSSKQSDLFSRPRKSGMEFQRNDEL
eukprot:XP_003728952.1 PREDICTED: transmembrane prolyl 4-hydroxylase [Strongylocentrotus purpuratus]